MLRVNGLQAFVDALLSLYGANELLGLFLFLFIEGPASLSGFCLAMSWLCWPGAGQAERRGVSR